MTQQRLVLSLPVTQCSYGTFLREVFNLSECRKSSYICFGNVHMLAECHLNSDFYESVKGADLVAPDGKPISMLVELMYGIKQDKISGPDMFIDILKRCQHTGKSVFFYGSTNDVLSSLKQQLEVDFPSLIVKGMYSPPFRNLETEEKLQIISLINTLKPDFTFVALGCPKQERWMALNKGVLNTCMLGVGQAFDIYAGHRKRAPRWIQNSGMEWMFRLLAEPRRLCKRYLFTNALFVYLLVTKGTMFLFKKKLMNRSL